MLPLTSTNSGAAGALLVYDITRRETFENILKWYEEAKKNSTPHMVILLVGNKCDLDDRRVVSFEEGESFAKEHNMTFIETSAKTAVHVTKAFEQLSEHILMSIENGNIDIENEVFLWTQSISSVGHRYCRSMYEVYRDVG